MAKLKATPKSYVEAAQYLAGRDSVKLGNNTWLERHEKEGTGYSPFIAVRLHNTNVVVFWESGRITLHTEGYRTVTTKDRINEFITGRVYQKNHQWYLVRHAADGSLDWDNPRDFADGISVE